MEKYYAEKDVLAFMELFKRTPYAFILLCDALLCERSSYIRDLGQPVNRLKGNTTLSKVATPALSNNYSLVIDRYVHDEAIKKTLKEKAINFGDVKNKSLTPVIYTSDMLMNDARYHNYDSYDTLAEDFIARYEPTLLLQKSAKEPDSFFFTAHSHMQLPITQSYEGKKLSKVRVPPVVKLCLREQAQDDEDLLEIEFPGHTYSVIERSQENFGLSSFDSAKFNVTPFKYFFSKDKGYGIKENKFESLVTSYTDVAFNFNSRISPFVHNVSDSHYLLAIILKCNTHVNDSHIYNFVKHTQSNSLVHMAPTLLIDYLVSRPELRSLICDTYGFPEIEEGIMERQYQGDDNYCTNAFHEALFRLWDEILDVKLMK